MDDIILRLGQRGNCAVKGSDVEEAKRETNIDSHDWIIVNCYRENMVFK